MSWQNEPCWRCAHIHPRHCDLCSQNPPCADHECSWPEDDEED